MAATLDPDLANLLAGLGAAGQPALEEQTPEQARAFFKAFTALAPPPVDVASVRDVAIPVSGGEIGARLYQPQGPSGGLLVWYHGGGWVIGDLDTADPTARMLCHGAGTTVLSVDYRLAPEHKWPVPAEDAWAALRWAVGHAADLGADAARTAVGGDSAGGHLAALVARRAAAEGGPELRHQLLVYPVADLTASTPSYTENAEGYFLTATAMRWFIDHLIGGTGADPADPAVSPARSDPAQLAGVAPATVLTAGFDPLRDEGDAYAALLAAAGVPVVLDRNPSMVHGFFSMGAIAPAVELAHRRAVALLRAALA